MAKVALHIINSEQLMKKKLLIIIGLVAAFVLAGVVGWLLGGCNTQETPLESRESLTEAPKSYIPADWQTYANNEYGIEIRWPGDWKAGGPGFMNEEWRKETYKGIQPKPEAVLNVWGPQGGQVYSLVIYSNPSKLNLLEWIQKVYDSKSIYEWKAAENKKDAIETFSRGKLKGEWSDFPWAASTFYISQSGYIIGYKPPQEDVLETVYSSEKEKKRVYELMIKYGLKFK